MTTVTPPDLNQLHDGQLTGITFQGSTAYLHCRSVTGQSSIISITAVVDFFATNLRAKNTILAILMISAIKDVPRALVDGLAQSPESWVVGPYIARAEAREAPELMRYFVLQSSYGCDLIAVHGGDVRWEVVPVEVP